jgi:hypothetical protein
MKDRTLKISSRPALGLALVAAAGASCTPNSQPNTSASATLSPPPPGYATSPGYPGYPQQPGYYPPQQQGYPAQPAGQPVQQTPPTYAPPGNAAPPPGQPPAYAPPPSYAPGPAPQQAPGMAPPPAGSSQTPPPPLAPTDPSSLQGIIQGIQGALQGQLVAPGSMPADVTEAGLKLHAVHVAPGMQPEGNELKQSLAEGQHAVMMVTLQAGKCYAIVGFSPPGGVKDIDLNLLAPPFYLTLAGQDLTHDNTPAIGASPSPMCPVIAFPLQYKLDVFARSGSGQVAVQLYSKSK